MLKHLCKTFVRRAEAQGMKGRKRDEAMIEFMVGAWAALHEAGHPQSDHINVVLSMVLTVRGYAECLRIANASDAEAA